MRTKIQKRLIVKIPGLSTPKIVDLHSKQTKFASFVPVKNDKMCTKVAKVIKVTKTFPKPSSKLMSCKKTMNSRKFQNTSQEKTTLEMLIPPLENYLGPNNPFSSQSSKSVSSTSNNSFTKIIENGQNNNNSEKMGSTFQVKGKVITENGRKKYLIEQRVASFETNKLLNLRKHKKVSKRKLNCQNYDETNQTIPLFESKRNRLSFPYVEGGLRNSLPLINTVNINECTMVFKPVISKEKGKTPRTSFVNGLFGAESSTIPLKVFSHSKLNSFVHEESKAATHDEQQVSEEGIDQEINERSDVSDIGANIEISGHINVQGECETIVDQENLILKSNDHVEETYQDEEQGEAIDQGKKHHDSNSAKVSDYLYLYKQIHNVDLDSSDLKKALKLSQSFAVFDESFSNIPQTILKNDPPSIPERNTLNDTLSMSYEQDASFADIEFPIRANHCSSKPQSSRNSRIKEATGFHRRNSMSTCSESLSLSADEDMTGIAMPEEDLSHDFYEGPLKRPWSNNWTANDVKASQQSWGVDQNNIPHYSHHKLNKSDSRISLEDNNQNYQLFCDVLSDDSSANLTRMSCDESIDMPALGSNIVTSQKILKTSSLYKSPSSSSISSNISELLSSNGIPEYPTNKLQTTAINEPSSSFTKSDMFCLLGTDMRLGTICCVAAQFINVEKHIDAHKHEATRFKCNECAVKFTRPHLFLGHVKKYHDLEFSPHKCFEDGCRLVFPTAFSLKIHHQEFHVEETKKTKNKCNACSKKVLTAGGEPDPQGEVLAPHIGEHALKVHREMWI